MTWILVAEDDIEMEGLIHEEDNPSEDDELDNINNDHDDVSSMNPSSDGSY